jgi:hypothetical protein
MAKTIAYCADGTWNGPMPPDARGADAEDADPPKVTNVYRLFDLLEGDPVPADGGPGLTRIQKSFTAPDGAKQLAMYCHGVGSNHLLPQMQFLGGAFGGGLTTRIRLGYAFISRNFEQGDRIVLVGFSRGSYTARALADMIATQGLLKPELADDHDPLSYAAAAWMRYRNGRIGRVDERPDLHQRIADLSMAIHRHLTDVVRRPLTDADFVETHVAAVAVWDTVGAMGIPRYSRENAKRIDEYEFASNVLSPKIDLAFHAVSVDEQRRDFAPTLWKLPDPRVTQELFPGGHSDVGGGYTDLDADGHPRPPLSGLTLLWMIKHLQDKVDLRFKSLGGVVGDARAPAHCAWLNKPIYQDNGPRIFSPGDATVNDAVRDRMAGPPVLADPRLEVRKYAPQNIEGLL